MKIKPTKIEIERLLQSFMTLVGFLLTSVNFIQFQYIMSLSALFSCE